MDCSYKEETAGFLSFLTEKRIKQHKMNLLSMSLYIVLKPLKGDEKIRNLILTIDFKMFVWQYHKEKKIKQISGIFLFKQDAERYARSLLEKLKGKG